MPGPLNSRHYCPRLDLKVDHVPNQPSPDLNAAASLNVLGIGPPEPIRIYPSVVPLPTGSASKSPSPASQAALDNMPRFKATTGLFVVVVTLLAITQLNNIRTKTNLHDEDSPPSMWNYAGVGLPSAQVDMAMIARNDTWRPKKISAFNAYHEQILEECATGGPCAKNNDKVVRAARCLHDRSGLIFIHCRS